MIKHEKMTDSIWIYLKKMYIVPNILQYIKENVKNYWMLMFFLVYQLFYSILRKMLKIVKH